MSTPGSGAAWSLPRRVVAALGAAVAVYGVVLLLAESGESLRRVAVWLAAGVVVHDVLIAAASLLAGALVVRAPRPARAPVAVGLAVAGIVALVAAPAWGRFGAKADNPTLLDVDYTRGAILGGALLLVAVVIAVVLRRGAGNPQAGHDGQIGQDAQAHGARDGEEGGSWE